MNKQESVSKMLQLRRHQFSIGSASTDLPATRPRFQAVSDDIGNFSPSHAGVAREVTAPPLNKRVERLRQDVPPQVVALRGSVDPTTDARLASENMFLRHNLRQSHWQIGGEAGGWDTRTTNQLAYEERRAPHPLNRRGFKNSWKILQPAVVDAMGTDRAPSGFHTVTRPDAAHPQPELGPLMRQRSGTAISAYAHTTDSAVKDNGLVVDHGITTRGLLQSDASRYFGGNTSSWASTASASYQRPQLPPQDELARQRASNWGRTLDFKYASHVKLVEPERALPVEEAYATETQRSFTASAVGGRTPPPQPSATEVYRRRFTAPPPADAAAAPAGSAPKAPEFPNLVWVNQDWHRASAGRSLIFNGGQSRNHYQTTYMRDAAVPPGTHAAAPK